MADVQHSDLTDPNLHEPKGVSSASNNQVYVADGSGSGTWKKVTTNEIDNTSIFGNLNEYYFKGTLQDISSVDFILIYIPFSCTFNQAHTLLDGSITGSNATISFTRNDAASFGTSITVTASGSAEGDIDVFTPTLNQTISAGGYIKVATDGASTNSRALEVSVKVTRTA